MCGLHLPPNCAGRPGSDFINGLSSCYGQQPWLWQNHFTNEHMTAYLRNTFICAAIVQMKKKKITLSSDAHVIWNSLGALEIDFYHRLRDIWFSFRAPAAVSDSESSSKSGHSHRQNWDWNITVTCEERVKMVVSVYLLGICGHRSC